MQVIDLFTHPDVLDRQRHLLANGDHNTPPSSPVELGQNDACTAGGFGELLSLDDPILACHRVQHQQRFMGCIRDLPVNNSPNLGQLIHQVDFSMQATRRINDQHVGI